MKKSFFFRFAVFGFAVVALMPAALADQTKTNNSANLELGGSWVSGNAPGGTDNAIWDATVATPANCTNLLGAPVAWNGVVINNPSAPVAINGNTTLTLSNGVNLANAAVNLSINCGTIDLGANQTWNVTTGRTLTTGSSTNSGSVNSPNNGNFTITKTGGGVWTTSGSGDNGSSGIIVNAGLVNLNKASSSGAHAVGGPGLTINNGGIARITGTGGDQIYDGVIVNITSGGTFDLNGNNETVAGLSGAGGTVDNTASGKSATLTLGNLTLGNGNSTFSGTIQNSGNGATLAVVKSGSGTITLNGANTYTGGTTVSSGTLAITTTANAPMAYTNNGGTLDVVAASSASSLPMTGLTLASSVQMTFDFNSYRNRTAPNINNTGNLVMNGNVSVNVLNLTQSGTYVLLKYAGTRVGTGSFIAGTVPLGATITDDTINQQVTLTYVSLTEPRVFVPTLNSTDAVVAIATPQQYGAKGDGISDDTAAFQSAMNAVFDQGGSGGGVVFVPVGNYAFYTNLVIPTGVTLRGDWTDWTKGTGGLIGTTFKVYFGAGQTNATAFITLNHASALRDVNIWYPNQNAAAIVGYPFTIGVNSDCVVKDIVLVNSYQGIETSGAAEHILSTIIGTPLYQGIFSDQIFDVCHAEDIRFSPDLWPTSLVTNAPASGGPHAAWMRANGEGLHLLRVDGDMCMDTFISGYSVGIEANTATNGQTGGTFYTGAITNCATALLAEDMPSGLGLIFSEFVLDGDIAVNRTNTSDDANVFFDHCQIIGRIGPAISSIGSDWASWMQFQDCTISNALQLTGPGVFNVVNSTLLGSTQCVLSASTTRAAFTGCAFGSPTNIVNLGNAGNVLIDPRQSASNALPPIEWTNVLANYESRQPAKTNLYVVTDAPWGAYGNGVNDDTAAIQSALIAAGINGGGIVYVPAGKYHLTNTLDVPNGVELRGAYELRHGTAPGSDGHAKGTILQPYGGQGTTNGPPAIALEASSGVRGMTISYENQSSNCIPFPPAIQGRGGNVYAIGICCPNPYYYVDLDTYTCTNHFIDMLDGWAIWLGYHVGNGSSGTIVDCHCNWTYWVDNADSQSSLPGSVQAPVLNFVSHSLQMYVLGNCAETMVKDFSIIENTFIDCVSENGQGPVANMIGSYCDGTIQGFVLDAAGPSFINALNSPVCVFNFTSYQDLDDATVEIRSTTNFQGTARFTALQAFAGPNQNIVVNGGDVGFDLLRLQEYASQGTIVNGGVLHLANTSAVSADSGTSNYPPYTVAFSANAGLPGKTSDFIGSFAYNGCGVINPSTNNPLNCWNDYALATYSVLNPNLPVVFNFEPGGLSLFQFTNAFGFSVASPAGIATNKITVTLDGVVLTNLVFSGSAVGWNVSGGGLSLNTFNTAVISVTDNANHTVSAAVSFDTFSPDNYTFEAEDFDYTSNGVSDLFIDNPQTNAFANLAATDEIDCHNASGGDTAYRPNPSGLATESANDLPRAAYAGGLEDYDVGWNNSGNWGNYTRTYPPGTYYIYMRAASPNGSPVTTDAANMALVTRGLGTTNQTTSRLGTFTVPNTGDWHRFIWVPLLNAQGHLVQFAGGALKTLRVSTDNGGYNVNFYLLAPTTTSATSLGVSASSGNLVTSFPTQLGLSYQLEYENDLAEANWTPIGGAITGNGSVQSITNGTSSQSGFYRVEIK